MQEEGKQWSGEIEGILKRMEACRQDYQKAQEAVKQEEARLQDFLHAIEFAGDEEELHRTAARLRDSRIRRRQGKDRMLELEYIIRYLDEPSYKKAFSGLRQLLGNQRKREVYLNGDRKYYNRVNEEAEKNEGGSKT